MGISKYKLNNEVFTGERGFWTQNKVEEEMQQCLFFLPVSDDLFQISIPSHKHSMMVDLEQTKISSHLLVFVGVI